MTTMSSDDTPIQKRYPDDLALDMPVTRAAYGWSPAGGARTLDEATAFVGDLKNKGHYQRSVD